MNGLFEATLDGVAFSSIAPELILVDVHEDAPRMDTVTSSRPKRPGMLRARNVRQSLSVTLRYVVRTQDVARRAAVHDLVTAWALKGGRLTINSRPGKELAVVLDTPPSLGSSLKWTEEVALTFTAYVWPYWQSVTPPSVSAALIAHNGAYVLHDVLTVGGSLDALCTMTVYGLGGDMNRLRVAVGDTYFQLEGLGIPVGGGLMIGYSEEGLLHITPVGVEDTASRLHCRTADSSDDLLASPGDVQISVEADAPCTVRVTAKEMWA